MDLVVWTVQPFLGPVYIDPYGLSNNKELVQICRHTSIVRKTDFAAFSSEEFPSKIPSLFALDRCNTKLIYVVNRRKTVGPNLSSSLPLGRGLRKG